jgi:hypothetical protein
MTLLKPFALALFWCALRVFDARPLAHPGRWLLLSVLISAASVEAKPNFTVALLPALAGMVVYRRWVGHPVHCLLAAGLLIASGLALGLQALSYPISNLAVKPLAVFDAWAALFNPQANVWLLPKFVLSILFPLFVSLLYLGRARARIHLNFAWLCFVFGTAYSYLLVESSRVEHGNFTWSGQITLFILFVVSLVFFLQQNPWLVDQHRPRIQRRRFAVCVLVLALHLVSGIVWYLVHTNGMPIFEMQSNLW